MTEILDIAGYARISVDDELDRKNVSIENQKAIIEDYVKRIFPGSSLTFFEDRDRSGYTFEQREGYQQMRRGLMSHKYDILIVKDFSRFSRRNSRGLVELEDLRDAGVRIISIGDGIDFPNDDDWLKIQFQFLVNEMPVTDTSRKVRNVIKRRQQDGKWLCAAPYGYIINRKKEFEVVPEEAEVVRKIFDLYNNAGWGYKRIANHLTEQNIPTPRMCERMRLENEGKEPKRCVKAAWSIVSIQSILDNDFYIGTLRQGKTARAKINGKGIKRRESEQIVIENQHPAIIDYRTFATARSMREKRTRLNYRGIKKYDNVYSGFLECGDCGSPMFSLSRPDLDPAYTCGSYHSRGRKGCTSHHIHVATLDKLVKNYVRQLAERCNSMLDQINAEMEAGEQQVSETEDSVDHLCELLAGAQGELEIHKRQRVRDIYKNPEQAELLNNIYDNIEADLQKQIDGLNRQISVLSDKRNTVIQVNRVAKTALEVFGEILEKENLDKNDLDLLIDRILVYEDRLEIKLQPDIGLLLHCDASEKAINLEDNCKNSTNCTVVQRSTHRKDRVFESIVVNTFDPLEIYTEKDGEVIFKKYSPMGDLQDFAAQICESIGKNTGHIAAVSDRDSIIAVAGAPKRDLLEKRNSAELEQLMEQRKSYRYRAGEARLKPAEAVERYHLGVAAPIIAEGDLMGCVMLLLNENDSAPTESEQKLAQTVAGFLGKQMEN